MSHHLRVNRRIVLLLLRRSRYSFIGVFLYEGKVEIQRLIFFVFLKVVGCHLDPKFLELASWPMQMLVEIMYIGGYFLGC